MSTTQTADGWTFTQGSQTYGPYPTREQACEALYDSERGKAPAIDAQYRADFARGLADGLAVGKDDDLIDAVLEYISQEREAGARLEAQLVADERIALAAEADRLLDNELLIADWIDRQVDLRDAQQPRVVTSRIERMDDDDGIGEVIELDESDRSELRDLAVLLADPRVRQALLLDQGAVERITVKRNDDPELAHTDYRLGDVLIEVLDVPEHGRRVSVAQCGTEYMDAEKAERAAYNLLALLNDPRVKAAIAADREEHVAA